MHESVSPATCALCNAVVGVGTGYILNIEVFADPQMPPMSTDDIAAQNLDQTLNDVLKEVEKMTADDLQDGVHRKFSYRLCPACHRMYLANPLGMPRQVKMGRN